MIETIEFRSAVQTVDDRQSGPKQRNADRKRWPGQFLRFGTVGALNTLLDVLILNGLLWLFPTTNTMLVLLFNSLAYALGAVNSFFFNKYWTFAQRQRATWGEVRRFAITTLLGIMCNDALIWLANTLLHPLIAQRALWVNGSKIMAIAGTVCISYIGMRLWVFVHKTSEKDPQVVSAYPTVEELPVLHTDYKRR